VIGVSTRVLYGGGIAGPPPITNAMLADYGMHSSTVDPHTAHDSSPMQEAWWADVWVAPGQPITKIASVVRNAGILGAGGFNGFAIFDASGTPLWSSPNDDSLWTSAGLAVKTLATPIAAKSVLTHYRCALASRGYTTPPTMHYTVTSTPIVDGGGRQAFYNGSITAWPLSIDPATYGSSTGGYKPLIMLG
jgi:hypothetical protein